MTPNQGQVSLQEMHSLMDLLQSIDVGLVILDKDRKIHLWNGFMENHSGILPTKIFGRDILEVFPDIPEAWLRRKLNSVFLLESRSFTTWEQKPFLFKFKNNHPLTGASSFMYQNITFIPLLSLDGKVERVGMIIYDVTEIAIGKTRLKQANNALETLSQTDGLTQLNNRRHWEDCLNHEYDRTKRTCEPCSLVMFDIDHFKLVNDTYGHQAGDEVIRLTSKITRDSIRLVDIAGRYGGEEFAIILINCNAESALIFCERLRERIEKQIVIHNKQEIKWTISLGISEFKPSLANASAWLEESDQALYQAKESGRNKSIIFVTEDTKIQSIK